LTVFSETWPRSGLMRNGIAYQLPPLVPLTDATGPGLWPTPQTQYDGRSNQAWVEAKARADHKRRTGQYKKGCGSPAMMDLQRAVRLWPTPQAGDNRDRGNLSSPAVQRRALIGKQLMLSQVVSDESGALNPTWVEWLMGFPLGWTVLPPSETP
jgi:hypothetical protein